jgi:hypothetical protein
MKRPPTAEPMVLMEYYERERAYQASYKFKAYPLGCRLLIIILNIFNFSPASNTVIKQMHNMSISYPSSQAAKEEKVAENNMGSDRRTPSP